MREIELLTEKDMPYFEELEKEGKAVIIRFSSAEELLVFDVRKLVEIPGGLTTDQVAQWMFSEKDRIAAFMESQSEERREIFEKEQELELLELVLHCQLPDAERMKITEAIDAGIDENTIRRVLTSFISPEMRSQILSEALNALIDKREGKDKKEIPEKKEEKHALDPDAFCKKMGIGEGDVYVLSEDEVDGTYSHVEVVYET